MTKFIILSYLFFFYSLAFGDTTMIAGGAVSGVWSASHSPYIIQTGNITLNDGDSLTIGPGVVVMFSGPYRLSVFGVLRALGQADSVIHFTADTVANPAGWGGIRCWSARDSNRISHGLIENVRTTGTPDDVGAVAQFGAGRIAMDHVVFQNNRAAGSGGAYFCSGSGGALFTNCDFLRNYAYVNGGALFLTNVSPCTFVSCNFIGNSNGIGNPNGRNGGAVDSWYASGVFTSCTFLRNQSVAVGGAVRGHGTMSFTSCTFDSNRASTGGALYLDDSLSVFSMTDCLVRWNTSISYCGGLYLFDASPVVTNCQFIGNYSGDRGGAINCYRWSGTAHFENCLITQNTTNNQGGGLWVATYHHPTFRNCEFSWNSARYGGGVYSTNHGAPSFAHCEIIHNTSAQDGGAFFLDQYSTCTLDTCNINWNSSGGSGGGLLATGSFFAVNACSLSYNTALNGGGSAILNSCALNNPLSVSNSVVSGNQADSSGGGVYVQGTSCPTLETLLILDNHAGTSGGGIACVGAAVPEINRCDILRNQAPYGAGVYSNNSLPTISTSILAANAGHGLDLQNSPASQILFNCLYGNTSGNMAGNNLPVGLGLVNRINVNGNPCDSLSNLYLSPLLTDTAAGSYLPAAGSPCRDAGDSSLDCDADLTVPDIGAVQWTRDPLTLEPRALAINASVPNQVTLRWRQPDYICGHASLTYRIWSAPALGSAFDLIGTTPDLFFTDSTSLSNFDNRIYQVSWIQ
jgi:predicted outer membrane repeat protein